MIDPRNRCESLEKRRVDDTARAMGLKPLNSTWAKLEILIGLAAAAVGSKLLLGDGLRAIAGGGLIVLGGYLALAGHRSHVYLSQNRQTAFLLQALTRKDADPPDSGQEG